MYISCPGMVRAGFATTLLQVFSRFTIVYIISRNASIHDSWALQPTVFAWSLTEVSRKDRLCALLLWCELYDMRVYPKLKIIACACGAGDILPPCAQLVWCELSVLKDS